jgi:YidC/Oxa1 family membrane protein insertase
MDRKSIIIMAVAIGILFLLFPVVDHYFPPKPVPIVVRQTAPSQPAAANLPPVAPPSGAAPAPALKEPSAPERIVSVTNADLIWNFTSRGGGLKTVDLRNYPAVIQQGAATGTVTNPASLNENAPLPVLALTGEALAGNDDYTLRREGTKVRAEKLLPGGLRVVKEFEAGTNYLFTGHLWLENTSSQPLRVPARNVIVGTGTATGPLDDPTATGAFWYNGVKSQNILEKWFANRTLGCFPGTPRWQYQEGAGNVVWTAVHNQFFALAAIPSNPAPQVVIDKIAVPPPDLTGPTNSMSALLTNGYQTALVYPAAVLAPGQKLETSFTFYAGPKEYNRLARIGDEMGNNLDLIMDFTGIFGFFSKMLLLGMDGLHDHLTLPYGLTIIAITIIIKVVFWPLTNASNKSQKRMQALQPQLKAIADKYKDDAAKRNEKTMEFYKLHKVNPMGSCLPTLIQLPVFFGFYWMLRGAIELRGASFLWAFDLSQPDTVASLAGFPVNPLPLVMGATQLWQSHMMPPSPGMDPGQQKLMRYLPLMMIALFYRMPAALTLYWTVQNLLSILQLKLTKATGDPAAAPAPAPAVVRKKK